MSEPEGGLTAYVDRVRADHRRLSNGWCSCDTPLCPERYLLDHIDDLKQAYEAKVQDFARETQRASELQARLDALVPAPSEQTYEWGWRRTWDKPDDVVIAFSEDDARSRLNFLHNAVVTRRPVGSWETVEEASE